jgi:hypothetical protein
MTWEGQLNENAVDRGVIVGSSDLLDELQLCARFRNVDQGADDVGLVDKSDNIPNIPNNKSYLLSGLQLHAHIGT